MPLVQSSGALSGNGTSRVHTWAVPPTVGNTIIVVSVAWNGTLAPGIMASDTSAALYVEHATATNTTTRVSIHDATVVMSPTSTTITFMASADHSVVFMEWSGIVAPYYDTNASANGPAGGGGAHTLTVGPTATLAQANELIITGLGAATGLTNSLISAPSGYTGIAFEQNSPSFIGMGSAYKAVSSTAGVSAVWPWSSNGGSGEVAAAAIATYRLSSAVTVGLSGIAATATPGSMVNPANLTQKGVTGTVGTGAVGSLAKTRAKALAGNIATGAPGSMVNPANLTEKAIGQVAATGSVGSVTVAGSGDVIVALAGAAATGTPGSMTNPANAIAKALAQAGAAGSPGSMVNPANLLAKPLLGVTSVGSVGTVSVEGQGPVTPGRPVVEYVAGSARYRRDPNHVPILQRALAAKAERFVKPAPERAQRRAKAIEVEAAELVLEQPDAAEQSFAQLVDRWLAERPVMPSATDPAQQFLAQIALRIQQINAQAETAKLMRRMRDENDALALLLL